MGRRRVALCYATLVPLFMDRACLPRSGLAALTSAGRRFCAWPASKLLPAGWVATAGITRADMVIVWLIRVPRVMVAGFVGMGLAAAGAVMQALFRNPLAEPALVGTGSGAVLGAVIAFVTGWSVEVCGVGAAGGDDGGVSGIDRGLCHCDARRRHAAGHAAAGRDRDYFAAERGVEPVALHEYRQLANRAGDRLLDDGRAGCALLDARLVVRAVRRVGNAGGNRTGARSGSDSAGGRERRGPWVGYRRLEARSGVDGCDADGGLRGGGGDDRICGTGGAACGPAGGGARKPATASRERIDRRDISHSVRSGGAHAFIRRWRSAWA